MNAIRSPSAAGPAAATTPWTCSATASTPCPRRSAKPRRFPLGRYRGLAFGLVLHAGGAADVFLEGKAVRHGMLSRDHRGPRAVLNALDRLAGSYAGQCDTTRLRSWRSPKASSATTRPASAGPSPTTPTWPS